MKQEQATPIRCLPLILVSMCVTTVVLTYLGSHPPGDPLILAITNDEHPGAYALNKYGKTIPPDKVLDILSKEQLQELIEGYFESRQVECMELLPLGTNEMGTFNFICKEHAINRFTINNCLVYMFGRRNEAFEKSILDRYGCEIFSFDSRYEDKSEPSTKIKRFPFMLGETFTVDKSLKVMNFNSIRNSLQHAQRQISLVAMDNDLDTGWKILDDMVKPEVMRGVNNLFIDLYTKCPDDKCPGKETKLEFVNRANILKKLYDLGFRIYHSIRFSDVQSALPEDRDKTWYRLFLYNKNPSVIVY